MFSAWNKLVLPSACPEQLTDFVQLAKNLTFTGESALNVSAWRQIMSMKDGNSFAILTTALWLYGAAHAAEYLVTRSVCCFEGMSLQIPVLMCRSCEQPLCRAVQTGLSGICTFLPHTSLIELWHGTAPLLTAPVVSLLSHRSAFTMHVEAGHSAVPEEGPKDLRCPLCLYHTKYKRNMIDHIVLHRGNNVCHCVCVLWGECWTVPWSGFIKYFRLVSLNFSSLYMRTNMLEESLALYYLFVSFL